MSGELFIVATPIGNLDDITLRAIETLRSADLIAAEDTRHSRGLLNHLGIDRPLLSLHEHNEHARVAQVIERLRQGQRVALVSDAGTPLISDPGYPLVNAVVEAGFKVTPVPGASSVITALSAAGLPTDSFCFHGFLSHKEKERARRLEHIGRQSGTQVLFESTHRLMLLLRQVEQLLPQHQLVVAKELTKRHERFIRGSAQQCLAELERDSDLQKGEFVLLLYRAPGADADDDQTEALRLLAMLLQHMPLNQAVQITSSYSGLKRNKLYREALALSAAVDAPGS
jgi:16S rRNA (cytidine1402-2'-O)-methyltransferase